MKNFSLLAMGLLIYSCNEKISPELQSGNSTTVPPTVIPSEYFFRVTNNSPAILNYVLHKTGDGNFAKGCQISSINTPLTSDLYIGDSVTAHENKSYDISCYFETEELALFYNGLNFQVEASQNTCEYVGYSPYSYYDALPGATTGNFVGIACEGLNSATQALYAADIQSAASGEGAVYGVNTPTPCDTMVDISLPTADRIPLPIPSDFQNLCQFDYEGNGGGNGQNCDAGIMNIKIIPLVLYTNPVTQAESVVPSSAINTSHKCGGSIVSCVEGAIKQVPELVKVTRGTEVLATEVNSPFSKQYSLPALMGKRGANFDIVNFRRGLAAKDINYQNNADTSSEWGSLYSKMFDPNIMEKFAANRFADNSVIIETNSASPDYHAGYEAKKISGGINKVLYAADPFLGLNGSRVNPFYTFYCLDRAYEIKARIRMVVRDWDRVFSGSSSSLELISDANLQASARQDLPSNEEEIPNDPGSYNFFNDRDDWDNLIELQRTNTGGDDYDTYISNNGAGSVLITPVAGWWSPGIFPNQGPRD